jgi:hypothetical protein
MIKGHDCNPRSFSHESVSKRPAVLLLTFASGNRSLRRAASDASKGRSADEASGLNQSIGDAPFEHPCLMKSYGHSVMLA